MATNITLDNLIYPYFVIDGRKKKEGIKGFPRYFRFSIDRLRQDIAEARGLGLSKFLLFAVTDDKDNLGSSAYRQDNIISKAVSEIKKDCADITLITDICLCAYTSHGHCGILKTQGTEQKGGNAVIDNERTIGALAEIALLHAQAGADWVAPSAMAKRQVLAIREKLDKNDLKKTKILGYSAKFASNFYGPFRRAARSTPQIGDRSGYQLDYRDAESALLRIEDDIKEGADAVMVKPALGYLDIVKEAKQRFNFPLAAYNVSAEYVMVKYAAQSGLCDEKKIVFEVLTSIKRAGADFIITYHAKDIARWLKKEN